MSNHKAHFRGDIQVDGSIVGPDGQPVGGSVDVSGLLPVDGSRAMTGPLKFGPTEIDPIWNGYAVAVESDTHDFGDFVVGNPNGDSYVEIYSVDDPSSTNLLLQAANNNYVSAVANSLGAALAVHNDTTFARLSTTYGLELDLQPDALGIAMRDNTVDFNYYRWQVTPHGEMHWGGGAAAPDVTLKRSGVGWMTLTAQELDIMGGANGSIFVVEDEDWTTYAQYGVKGMEFDYAGGFTTLHVNSNQPQFWMSDVDATLNFGTTQQHYYYQTDDPTHHFMSFMVAGDEHFRFRLDQNGKLYWGPGGSNGEDTHLKRRAAGVLELEESGGGLVLHSPDGTAYKISVANGGALSAVAV